MKKAIVPFVLLFFTAFVSCAQKSYWIGADMYQLNFETDKYFNGNYQNHPGPARIFVGVPLKDKIRIMPSLSLGNVTDEVGGSKNLFWKLDAAATYSFIEGKVLEPYALAGVGVNQIDERTHGLITAGVGLHVWITEGLALHLQTNWDGMLKQRPYWQNSIGLTFKLGGGPADSDKDGIPDDQDACPKQAGPAATLGCPDADGDGVKDSDDACPNQAGTVAAKGCPDADGDGIVDSKDECPNEKGVEQFNGCPDADGDGIPDKKDSCPNQKGLAQFNGCPDTDGDGIQDKDDACPNDAGKKELNGCPDKDGDGIVDKDDQCPDQAGPASTKGCPEIKEEEAKAIEQKLNVAAKKIQFETGSAKLKQSSFAEIDQVVTLMKQYTFTKFDIDGHTDNVGNAANNKALSQQRAEAVRNYIVDQGVGGDRLTATGYGSDKPISPNTTAAGRAENRRVEIHLRQ